MKTKGKMENNSVTETCPVVSQREGMMDWLTYAPNQDEIISEIASLFPGVSDEPSNTDPETECGLAPPLPVKTSR